LNPTIDLLNLNPINEKAKTMLQRLGEIVEPSCLHAVQLALWGIEKGGLDVDSAVVETVRAMPLWGPVRLMNFFIVAHDGEFSVTGWEAAETPADMARAVLAEIDGKTFQHFPCYLAAD
jgi:hypothetical protein